MINYREPLISRLIYLRRKAVFTVAKLKKKIKKIFSQRREYFSKEYYRSKFKKSEPVSVQAEKTNEKARPVLSEELPDGLNEKLAVYTCIFGSYDMICEPKYKSRYCDYYIITDGAVPDGSAWKKLDFQKPDGFDEWGPSIKNRYCKMHPHILFPSYRYSLYVDGNCRLLTDMYPFVSKLGKNAIGIFRYPLNDCFYENAKFLESLGLVDPEENKAMVEEYRVAGFPEHFGYFECCVILRDHHKEKCRRVMETWWKQYLTHVKRDQQSFMFSLWSNVMNKNDVSELGPNARKNERMTFIDHNRAHKLVKETAPKQ